MLTHSSGTLTISGSISDQNSVTTGLPAAACFDIGGGTVTGNGSISYQFPNSLDGVNVHDGATVTGGLTITTNYLYICNASVSLTGGTVNIDSGRRGGHGLGLDDEERRHLRRLQHDQPDD